MNLAEFAKWAVENGCFEGCDLDGGGIQDKALECGIIVQTKYDPDKHGPNPYDAPDAGEPWFVFSDDFYAGVEVHAHRSLAPAPSEFDILVMKERDEARALLREVILSAENSFEFIRLKLIDCLSEPERSAFWRAVKARDDLRNILGEGMTK